MSAEATVEAVDQADPRYPIGRFQLPESITPQDRMAAIASLAELPARLAEALEGLNEDQLETPYREGGWTVRQLVHHIADSHMNGVARIRMALTEEVPAVFAPNEKLWAMMHDSTAPVGWSTALLENLHARWVMLMESLDDDQWKRLYKHPTRGPVTVEFTTMLYAWHSRHHVAHIRRLREQMGW